MNNIKEMDAFIKKMAKLHFSYPTYVNKDTVYHQLMMLNIKDDIRNLKLDDIQLRLRKSFDKSMINSSFVWLNVKKSDESFTKSIDTATKVYVSLPNDKEHIYDIVSKIW